MRVKFMGMDTKAFTNKVTGERGMEYTLQVHDGHSVKTLRLSEEKYIRVRNVGLSPFADVDLRFELADGRFGQSFPAVAELVPAATREPVKS